MVAVENLLTPMMRWSEHAIGHNKQNLCKYCVKYAFVELSEGHTSANSKTSWPVALFALKKS